jgi:DNA-directed RNA polymerase specialized sigma24 family protein
MTQSETGSGRDIFPQTLATWIDDRIEEGPRGREELNRHVMSVYAAPLRVYFLGTSYRSLWEPDDVIQGFFASRLDRESFFRDWRASGKRLRRWLINAFLFFLKERYRQDVRHNAEPLPDEDADVFSAAAEGDLDRAWAFAIVREAWSKTAEACSSAGQQSHWEIFYRHHVKGHPYRDIASDHGVTREQATVMARTVTNRFRKALRTCIAHDGVDAAAIDREIEALLATMHG